MRHIHAAGFAAHPDRCGTRRGVVPNLLPAPPGGCPPPACCQASSPVTGGRAVSGALTLTEPLGRTWSSRTKCLAGRAMSRSSRPAAASSPRHIPGTGRHIDGGASALQSAGTIPHRRAARAARRSAPIAPRRGDGALRHEPVTTWNGAPGLAPLAHRPAVTNFGFAKVSDSGRRPCAPSGFRGPAAVTSLPRLPCPGPIPMPAAPSAVRAAVTRVPAA